MTDVSNRRREPNGTPKGGRFADERKGTGDVSDLDEDMALGVPPTIPAWDHIEDTADSREALLDLAREVNGWDGSCDWADADDPEELMAAFGYQDPQAALELIDAVGDEYHPFKEYVRYNDYGRLESVDESDLENQASEEADDIRQYLEDTPEVARELDADILQGVRDGDTAALLAAAREANMWDGSFDWADATEDIESLTGVYGSGEHDAQWLVDRTFYGDYTPGHELIRFNGYGNFESLDELDLQQEAWDYREEILDQVKAEREHLDVDDMLARLDVVDEA